MLMPLSFVVIVSMIKDVFEDMKRHKSDNIENNKYVLMLDPNNGTFDKVKWRYVKVGRIVKVLQNE